MPLHELLGTYNELKKYDLSSYYRGVIDWCFNDRKGCIGVKCIDGISNKITFVEANEIKTPITQNSRHYTIINGLPNNINKERFLNICNNVLDEYRTNTKDVFLTTFKGVNNVGAYRKRVTFNTIKCILNKAYKIYQLNT